MGSRVGRLWLYHLPFMVVFDGAYADVLFFFEA